MPKQNLSVNRFSAALLVLSLLLSGCSDIIPEDLLKEFGIVDTPTVSQQQSPTTNNDSQEKQEKRPNDGLDRYSDNNNTTGRDVNLYNMDTDNTSGDVDLPAITNEQEMQRGELPEAKERREIGLRLPIAIRANIRVPVNLPVAEPSIGEFVEPGILRVGVDIQPGIYYGRADNPDEECRWIRLSQPEIESKYFIASNKVARRFFVEVKESDNSLYTTCPVAPVKSMPTRGTGKMLNIISPGTYLVGIDIAPGRYAFDPESSVSDRGTCSVYAFRGFAEINSSYATAQTDVIDSEVWQKDAGRFFFVVPRTALAIQTNCNGRIMSDQEEARRPLPLREWRRPYTPPPSGIKLYEQGEYTIREMPAGIYKVFSDPDMPYCRVIRYGNNQELSYEVFHGDAYFEVLPTDENVSLDENCYVASLEELPRPNIDPSQVIYLAGIYLVNYDIPPGKYRIETSYIERDSCTVAIRSNMAFTSMSKGEVVGSYIFRNGEYFIEIKPTDAGVVSTCVMERVE